MILNHSKSHFFPQYNVIASDRQATTTMLSLLCTESIVHLQQYLDLPTND